MLQQTNQKPSIPFGFSNKCDPQFFFYFFCSGPPNRTSMSIPFTHSVRHTLGRDVFLRSEVLGAVGLVMSGMRVSFLSKAISDTGSGMVLVGFMDLLDGDGGGVQCVW